MDRRQLLLALSGGALAPLIRERGARASAATTVAEENARTGDLGWCSPNVAGFLMATASPVSTAKWAAYARRSTVAVGEPVELCVGGPAPARLSIYRMGWYGGARGRPVGGPLPITPAPLTDDAPSWPVAASIDTTGWVSGCHLAVVTGPDGTMVYAPFVVRDPQSTASIAVMMPFTTYQAYNGWGGASLYDFNSPGGRAHTIGLQRPYDTFDGAGFFFYGDFHLVGWLEREGFDVTYLSSHDLHHGRLGRPRLLVSAFHDEYWSSPMRRTFEDALDRGVHAAFLGANSLYWRVRLDDERMICRKDLTGSDRFDPDGGELTTTWRDPRIGASEHLLLGTRYESYRFPYGRGHDWVVTEEQSWLYEGTGLRDGARIAGLVGYEWDRAPAGEMPGRRLVAGVDIDGRHRHDAAVVEHARATVVNVGTNYWPAHLTGDGLWPANAAVRQMTRNILTRLGG